MAAKSFEPYINVILILCDNIAIYCNLRKVAGIIEFCKHLI